MIFVLALIDTFNKGLFISSNACESIKTICTWNTVIKVCSKTIGTLCRFVYNFANFYSIFKRFAAYARAGGTLYSYNFFVSKIENHLPKMKKKKFRLLEYCISSDKSYIIGFLNLRRYQICNSFHSNINIFHDINFTC